MSTYIKPYNAENIEFLRSMERSRKAWSLRVLLTCMLWCAMGLLWMPHAEARGKTPSKAQQAELLQEIQVQLEEVIPYEGARTGELSKMTFRGSMPDLWKVELIVPSTWRTTRVQAKVFDIEHPERPAGFLQVNIEIHVPIYKLNTQIKSGDRLEKSMLEQEYVSVYKVPHDAITSPAQMSLKVARRDLPSGKVLQESMLDDPVVFRRGDVVKIRIKRGNVELVDTGMAMETGKLGHGARVKSTSTGSVLQGVVSEDGITY